MPRQDIISRPHLVSKIDDGLSGKLILISAPAGFGKTTLISEWLQQIDIPLAWLALDKDDNDLIRFITYLVAAIQTVTPEPANRVLEVLNSPSPPVAEEVITLLLNDLSDHLNSDQQGKPFILVLDDYHEIVARAVHNALTFMLDHLHPQIHLVITTRVDPPWSLARLRANQEITELRANDLRFTSDETGLFLNNVMHLNLSFDDVLRLNARTEGWIAGLQMAALSLQGRDDTTTFIRAFSGSHRFVLDYLMEEVLNRQTSEIQEFLLKTSIFERFTASLCDAVMGTEGSQGVISWLERANLFLIPLDNERQWYRYHHLFVDLLRKMLKENQHELINDLHRRASKWYAENDYLSEAISHALEAEDFLLVNELVSGNALVIVEHAELLEILRQLEKLVKLPISSKPWLYIAYNWVKAYADPSEGMFQDLQSAEQYLTSLENNLEKSHLICHLNAIRAYVAWVKGEADLALAYTQDALIDLPSADWITRAHLFNIEGLAWQYLDKLPLARQSFEKAIVAGRQSGRMQETFKAFTNLAYLEFLQGKLHRAFSLCQQALSLENESANLSKHMPIAAHAYATLSLVQLEWNDLDSAILTARQGVSLAEQWKQIDVLHFSLNTLSKALCASGDLDEAFSVNQRAMQLTKNISPWYFLVSSCNDIRLSLIRGDIPLAANRFAEIEPLFDERTRDRFLIIKTFLLFSQERFSDMLVTIDDAIEEISKRGEMRDVITLLPLKALALQALNREDEAISVIAQCLVFAAPEGYIRIFVENGSQMAGLLRKALQFNVQPEYAGKLLTEISNDQARKRASNTLRFAEDAEESGLIESLSKRELEILALIAEGSTNQEIAQELVLSLYTIKSHVRNIFSKLGVKNRTEAVARARLLGLLFHDRI